MRKRSFQCVILCWCRKLKVTFQRCRLPSSALELLQTAIEKAGFTDKVVVGMDVAASEFYREGKYDLDFKSPPDPERHISAEELADIYQGFVNNYPGAASSIPDEPSTLFHHL